MNNWLKILLAVSLFLAIGIYAFNTISLSTPLIPKPLSAINLKTDSITIGNLKRSFLWSKPESIKNINTILFVFHGSKSDGSTIRKQTSYAFDELAQKENFIVVYPTGYFNHWNDCRGSASYKANVEDIDDISFLKKIEQKIESELSINFDYEFATGFSNGGHFCFKLALEAPDWIDGIAAISANLPANYNLDCRKSNQFVPILLCNGTGDKINPYNGGLVEIRGDTTRGRVRSTDQTINYWQNLNNELTAQKIISLADTNPDDHCTVELHSWNSNSVSKISLYKIIDGGHTIPHPKSEFHKVLGNINKDVNMPALIWDFFEKIASENN